MDLATQSKLKHFFPQFIFNLDRNFIKVSPHSLYTIYYKAGEMHPKDEQSSVACRKMSNLLVNELDVRQ